MGVVQQEERKRFEECVLPHLDAAFNLARWLLRSREDAEDVTQEAMLRAYRFFGGYRAGDARAENLAIAGFDRERLASALDSLPPHFREVLVLRELEGCSYKEIAAITSRPIGTIMSSLARGRQQLKKALTQPKESEARRAV